MTEIPYGLCKCGCGEKTRIATQTRPERGDVKGEPVQFRRGHNHRKPLDEIFWSHVEAKDDPHECWIWRGALAGRMGYGKLKFQGKARSAHRVSWELAHKRPVPDGFLVCHHCDVPACVNPDHLLLGTQAENLADRDSKGRAVYYRGAANPTSKLTDDKVREIRQRAAKGETRRALAADFGVSSATITHIVHRRAWSHVS